MSRFIKKLNKLLDIPTLLFAWLLFPVFVTASPQPFFLTEETSDNKNKHHIIHITTEFLEAKAGGLGAIVNEIVKLQASKGYNVTVILPFFQNNDGSSIYDFQVKAQAQPKKLSQQ